LLSTPQCAINGLCICWTSCFVLIATYHVQQTILRLFLLFRSVSIF
jgi:hypothetical protein